MPPLRHSKHEAFCRAYVSGPHAGNILQCYRAAGFTPIRSNASRLAGRDSIRRRISELVAEEAEIERFAMRTAAATLALDKQAVLAELMKVGFANVVDFISVDAEGRATFDLARLNRAKGAAIRDLAVEFGEAPDDAKVRRVRVQLFDKPRALIELGRHLGLFATKQAAAAAQPPGKPFHEMSNAELEHALIMVFAQMAAHNVDVKGILDHAMAAGVVRQKPTAVMPRDLVSAETAMTRPWASDGSGVHTDRAPAQLRCADT